MMDDYLKDSLKFGEHYTVGTTADGYPCIKKKYKDSNYEEVIYTNKMPIMGVYDLLKSAYMKGVQDVSDILKPLL
jgi:hypothetical protein